MIRRRYVLELEAGPHPQPAEVRIRSLLKIAGRGLSLRCIQCREVAAGSEPTNSSPPAKPVHEGNVHHA